MANAELIDVQAANAEVRALEKRAAAKRAADYCGAANVAQFVEAAAMWLHEVNEIERKGFCLACGTPLVGESVCVRCGRDNS